MADLLFSREFELGGQCFDLRHLIPHGITQSGTASATPAAAPPGVTRALPFVGSAVAVGGGERGYRDVNLAS